MVVRSQHSYRRCRVAFTHNKKRIAVWETEIARSIDKVGSRPDERMCTTPVSHQEVVSEEDLKSDSGPQIYLFAVEGVARIGLSMVLHLMETENDLLPVAAATVF